MAVAGGGDVPTRSPSALVAVAPCGRWARRGVRPGVGAVRSSARGARPHSARWAHPWRAPRPWLDGTGSVAWPCHREGTHAVGIAACPPAARTGRSAGWLDTGRPHPGTTAGCQRLRRRDRPGQSAPFYLGVGVDHGHHASLALALCRPRRTPGARALVRTAGVLQHAPNRAGAHPR